MKEDELHFEGVFTEAQPHSRKEAEWIKKENDVKKIPDLEGGVIKIVTALNVLGVLTSQSCEGHINESGITAPFVEISAPNQPTKRFVGQEKAIKKVAKNPQYNIRAEDVETTILHSAPWKEFEGSQETQNYKKWRQENKKMAQKLETLLKIFYQISTTPAHVRLTITERSAGQFEISNIGKEQYWQIAGKKDLAPDQETEPNKLLAQYQKEMDKFAEFIRVKYFTK